MKKYIKIVLLMPLIISTSAYSQTTAKLIMAFANPRSLDATHNQVDITIAAGSSYVTNDAYYKGSGTPLNPDGSWEGINFRFTQSANWLPSDIMVTYPTAGFNGPAVPANSIAGGCYPTQAAFDIAIDRNAGGPDATSTPILIATLTTPKTPNILTIRNTTTQACATRETFWTNSNATNTGTRLAVAGNSVPLAVKLTGFEAQKAGENKVAISWAIANEQGVASFEVQRAQDGKSFNKLVATQIPAGKASNQYQVLDNSPVAGVNYYRIKVTGANGDYTYSLVKTVSFGKDRVFALSPNPAGNYVLIQGITSGSVINVVANTGQVLSHTISDDNTQKLNVASLTPGIYFVQVTKEGKMLYTAKFVKQ